MAITFEEKNNSSMMAFIVVLGVIIVGAAGFLVWQSFAKNTKSAPVAAPMAERLDDQILKDPSLGSLELFPEIPPSAIPPGKNDPFLEGDSATGTASAMPYGQTGSSSLPAELLAPLE